MSRSSSSVVPGPETGSRPEAPISAMSALRPDVPDAARGPTRAPLKERRSPPMTMSLARNCSCPAITGSEFVMSIRSGRDLNRRAASRQVVPLSMKTMALSGIKVAAVAAILRFACTAERDFCSKLGSTEATDGWRTAPCTRTTRSWRSKKSRSRRSVAGDAPVADCNSADPALCRLSRMARIFWCRA